MVPVTFSEAEVLPKLLFEVPYHHHLYIIIGTAVVQCYKLVVAESPHPSHYRYFLSLRLHGQQLLYFDPLVEHF